MPGVLQSVRKRLENKLAIFGSRAVAHEANAENLARERSEAAGDLDAALFEKILTHLRIVDSLRNAGRVPAPQTVSRVGDEHLEAHFLDSGDDLQMVLTMPLPAIFEALFVDDREALTKRVEHGRRGGVVVAVAGIITVEQLEVEIPGVD